MALIPLIIGCHCHRNRRRRHDTKRTVFLLGSFYTNNADCTRFYARRLYRAGMDKMTNAQHAIALIDEAIAKMDADLDPRYQLDQAKKMMLAADNDVIMWRNKYLMKITEPVK